MKKFLKNTLYLKNRILVSLIFYTSLLLVPFLIFGSTLILKLLFLEGLILIFSSFISFKETLKFLKQSALANGEIIDIVYDERIEFFSEYKPLVKFTIKNNINVEFINSVKGKGFNGIYKVGDRVEILYNLNNPNEAYINTKFSIWFRTSTIFISGFVISIASSFLLIS